MTVFGQFCNLLRLGVDQAIDEMAVEDTQLRMVINNVLIWTVRQDYVRTRAVRFPTGIVMEFVQHLHSLV